VKDGSLAGPKVLQVLKRKGQKPNGGLGIGAKWRQQRLLQPLLLLARGRGGPQHCLPNLCPLPRVSPTLSAFQSSGVGKIGSGSCPQQPLISPYFNSLGSY